MMHVKLYFTILIFFTLSCVASAQKNHLNFFIAEGLKNNPSLLENDNLQQYFQIQNEFITAQYKKPQLGFTADYLFAPFFFDNGKPVSITLNPSPKAYGYDVGLTNGGLYAAQLNVSIPLFNAASIKKLYEQNKIQSQISSYSRKQMEHDITKAITDQYIVTYQFQEQTVYLQKIIDQLQSRKPLVEALVKKGLLQQNDYLLLDIQLLSNKNDLTQLQFAYNNGLALLKNLSLINDSSNYILVRPSIFQTTDPAEYYYVQKFKLDSLNLLAQQNVFNSKYKPQVSVLGTTGLNAADVRNVPHNIGISTGIHLSIPIYDGHQRKLYERQNAVLQINQQLYKNSTALQQQNNLRNAKQQIDQWKQTIEMAMVPIQKQELLLDIIKDKVVMGQVTVMDYIDALQQYAVLQKNKAIAETNLLLYINQYNYYNW